jgi:hypothetical protein
MDDENKYSRARARAEHLIERGYPTETKDVDVLTKRIMAKDDEVQLQEGVTSAQVLNE